MSFLPSQPLYQKIKEDILNKIEGNLLKPGDRLPTEQQFMAKYGVSRITVSKALNELKDEGIVVRFPHNGTFISESLSPSPLISEVTIPPVSARVPPSMKEIACIIPSMDDLFAISLINGILSAFPSDTYTCHIFLSKNSATESYLLQRCMELNILGIVLFPQNHFFFSDQLLSMQLKKYPFVLIDRYLPHLDTSYVIADNHAAGSLCLQHLHDLGHQRIAFVSDTDQNTFSIKRRIEGIRETAASLNIPDYAIQIIENLDTRKRFSYYHDLFLKLILQQRITAFIASESSICSYLYDLFLHIGFHVPDKISLITFDKPVTKHRNPDFFTHIDQSEFLMGHEAGMILKNKIEQQDINVYHKIITPTLRIHESTRPATL